MKIQTNLHTIYLLVGPSNCGKSYFSKEVMIPALKSIDQTFNVQYISSDEIRREILGESSYHKHDDEMLFVSEQAFNILYSKIRNVTMYPVNAEFVILDTSGLSEEFRNKIRDIAKENHYNIETIIFNYKNKSDYFKYMDDDEKLIKGVIHKHIKRLREKALPRISKKGFRRIHKITNNDFSDIEFEVEDYEEYLDHILVSDPRIDYVIIGDAHGCYDELVTILEKNKFIVDKENYKITLPSEYYEGDESLRKIILTGDIIDKGSDVEKVLNLIDNNIDLFHLIKGNHENFVYKYLNNEVPELPEQDVIDTYFTCIREFQENTNLKELFFKVYGNMQEFYKHKYFIVTHAPCKRKYLGKLDQVSLRNMRTFRYSKRADFEKEKEYVTTVENELSFIEKDATSHHPYHVFGHIPFQNRFRMKNKIGIDTGCVEGGYLSSVIVNSLWKPFFQDVKSSIESTTKLLEIFKRDYNYLADIHEEDLRRINRMVKNKVNFVSGTISPSDKLDDDLESLESGLNYYKEKGVDRVMLQPKYMGSRCQVYLGESVENSFSVSRNGYKIKHVDMTPVYERLLKTHGHLFDTFKDARLIMMDGELMPWYALGKGLIENQYRVCSSGIKSEIDFLTENKFEEFFNSYDQEVYQAFRNDLSKKIDKKSLIDKYGHAVYTTLHNKVLFEKEFEGLSNDAKWLEEFHKQVELYSQDTPIDYKPFSLLKVFYKDGTEKTFFDSSNEYLYNTISADTYKIIDFSDENYLEEAQYFYDSITCERSMEGIVIKPNDNVYVPKIAPYMKVRNKKYLTLVYGYDYLHHNKYAKLLVQKSINKKLRLSVDEFETGKRLLQIHSDDLVSSNTEYKNLLGKMIIELKSEEGLDPRL